MSERSEAEDLGGRGAPVPPDRNEAEGRAFLDPGARTTSGRIARRMTPAPKRAANVFLLDDEPAVQAVLCRALETRGLSVFGSTQWSEVAQKVFNSKAETGPACLVADLNMPGIRGEDFCRIVRQYRPNMLLVLYTGAERVDAEAAAKRLGGIPVVLKREGATRLAELLAELIAQDGLGAEVST